LIDHTCSREAQVCPSPTTFTHGTKTYTVTQPTTLTITSRAILRIACETDTNRMSTDCPCTYSIPVTISSAAPTSNYTVPSPVWTTVTVSTYVTICPTPTTFTAGSSTYTVTEATTLTITSKCTDRNVLHVQLTFPRLPLYHQLLYYTGHNDHHDYCVNLYHLLPKPNYYCGQQSDIQCY
jgi:hypothetical protein